MSKRYDAVDLGKARITEDGFIRDEPVLTRSGIFPYRHQGPRGPVTHEFRPPEEVFRPEAMAALRGVPITTEHRTAKAGAADHVIGSIVSDGERRDEDKLVAQVVIYHPERMGTRRHLSLGYEVDYDPTPGEHAGQRYDGVQRNIRAFNHLAVVQQGRAGVALLRLDEDDAVSTDLPTTTDQQEEPLPADPKTMAVRLDGGLAYDAPAELAVAFEQQRAALAAEKRRADEADNRMAQSALASQARLDEAVAAEKKRVDALEAECNTLKAAVGRHDAALAQARTDAISEVKARLVLEADAVKHGVEVRADMADRAVREAVVAKLSPDTHRFDGRSDDYVLAAFDLAIAASEKAKDTAAHNRAAATGGSAPRADAAPSAPGTIRSAADLRAALRRVG